MEVKTNREHKDRLFKMAFMDKKDLLELYNAVNGTDYDNPDELIINTLENVIYMGMKNDLSFIIDDILNLYEHQSTFNPNMPLRGLFYITNIYKNIVGNDVDIYSSRQIELPLPKYIVFYNGTEEEPEQMELSIRDAFDEHRRDESCLDFRATMLNINMGCHKELMAKCKRLRDYAQLISRIREYLSQKYTIEDALDQAVDDCIREDILKDILLKNKLEVFEMILTEYNEQNHIANEKKLSKAEGKTEGKAEAILDLLQEFGELSDVLQEQIMSETDLEILTKWLKLAARSDSIDEFMTQMNR